MTSLHTASAPDLRNDLAKARDKYLDSFLGREACDLSTLTGERAALYLRNRIEHAFVAGWNAKEALSDEQVTP